MQPLTMLHNDWAKALGIEEAYWPKILHLIFICAIALVFVRVVSVLIEKYRHFALLSVETDALVPGGGVKRVETVCLILRNAMRVVTVLVLFFVGLDEFGINILPFMAGASVAGVAIGLGAQSLAKDLLYGFFILCENQFGIGDIIQVGQDVGTVEHMSLRKITLRDMDGRVHIIPNGETSKVIVYTRDWSCMNLDVQVDYAADLDTVFQELQKLSQRFYQENASLLLESPRNLGVNSFESNGIALRITAKTVPQKQWEVSRLYRKCLKEHFDKVGIPLGYQSQPAVTTQQSPTR